MRNLTPAMAAEVAGHNIRPALLAELQFDSATLYMWSGIGTLTWNGNDYLGGGNLISISTIEETQKLEAKGIVCSLNGIPSNLIAAALLERTRGRPFRMYLAAVDDGSGASVLLKDDDVSYLQKDDEVSLIIKDGSDIPVANTIVMDPYRIFTGLMDVIEFSDDGNTAMLRLSVESVQLLGQRAKIRRYTAEDQKKVYSNDLGLDLINQLQDKEIVW